MIVEAFAGNHPAARIVAAIHVDREQIANRVGVFGRDSCRCNAVTPGFGFAFAARSMDVFESLTEVFVTLRGPAAALRSAASFRREASG